MAKGTDSPAVTNNVSIIGAGTEINGEVKCGGDLRIDGSVKGNLQVKGKLVIGDAGRVEGEVECRNGDVSGQMKGKIKVQELLSLKSTSKLYGDIITKRLSIEPGSIFTGSCNMGDTEEGNSPSSSFNRD